MNMKSLLLVLCCLLAVSCSKNDTPEALLDSSKYWDYAYSGIFGDGGSVALGFINENGELIYLWVDSPLKSPDQRRFYLQSTYNDPEAKEVMEGSLLEIKILNLLTTSHTYTFLKPHLPDINLIIEIIQDRKRPFPHFIRVAENIKNAEQGACTQPSVAEAPSGE